MAIEETRNDYVISLRYKFLVGAAYTALGTLAIAAGVWGGSRFTSHPQRDTPCLHSVGGEAQPRVARLENSVADGHSIAEYAPFGSVKINNDFFAVLLDQNGVVHAGSAISGTGFGDVYDRKGRLVRRYTAIEDTNSSWQLVEFMRLPSNNPK